MYVYIHMCTNEAATMLKQAAVFGWADKTPARQFGEELRAVGGPRWSSGNYEDMDTIDILSYVMKDY